MALNYISAAEAASLIKHGYNIGLSGFTPAGTAKAVTAELAKIAEAEHAKGNPFQIGIFTGASTGDSCDGILSRAKAIRYRAPYTTNADFRKDRDGIAELNNPQQRGANQQTGDDLAHHLGCLEFAGNQAKKLSRNQYDCKITEE
mgnify:CR=1 FL=1